MSSAETKEFKVGTMITRNGREAMVTRIVDSTSFFWDHKTDKCYILTELYLETLDKAGETGFMTLRENSEQVDRPATPFKGPDVLNWRRLMFAEEGANER
jgi:hypothetical protein